MEKVKQLLEAGLTVPEAIKQALGMTVTDFCEKHGLPRSSTTEVLNCRTTPTDAQVAALRAELGGSEFEIRHLLWQGAEPKREDEAPRRRAAV